MHRWLSLFSLTLAAVWLAPPTYADEITITKQGLTRINQGIWAATGLTLPETDTNLPILGPANKQDGVRLLRFLMSKNAINGFNQIIYDNRDRGHSSLKLADYPALAHLKYGPELKSDNLDAGLAGRIVFPAVVFGNSSTAVTNGPAPRSLPRLAMTNPFWRQITPMLYANNHIYVYPEHRDHDDADLYPINWPYTIISQGSSGSDKVFLNAIALTLAALPADTFVFLRETGLIAPTVQMILRRNLKSVSSREDYLTGTAHPAAFQGRLVQAGRMVEQASKLRPEDVPPLVQLRVIQEDFLPSAGLAGLDERFLDTPAAIGRIWRSFASKRELLVTAEDTKAHTDKPLTFEWRLLRGDPERVSIEPQGPGGREAKIRIDWHDPWTEPDPLGDQSKTRRMSRVDVGVFANNGVHDSAPAMISIDFPEHQLRQYEGHEDGQMRLSKIDYDAKGRGAYFDPLIYWTAAWADTARYDESGTKLLGWDRVSADGVSADFVSHIPQYKSKDYELDVSDISAPILRALKDVAPVETE
ncbi:hypothetical protein OS189_14195 [Sulfitobacter sp. F26169L]|uniref:hypothetical protein n=1 Tax=Sulfitobacter sp. F26169L TaxID=2996015 RepID=UPI002260E8E2|nr:hypothetical protein [Sulfitobacter sp. F26169L]MCX7567496.1 hypothetical protein [Sulfitobacter sp. F26169L]